MITNTDMDKMIASYRDELNEKKERIAELEAALREIAKGEGRFSRDPFEHARNTIEDMKALAVAALNETQS